MAAVAEQSDAPDLAGLLRDVEALQSIVAGWDEQQRNTVEALQRAVDALHREAFARLIRTRCVPISTSTAATWNWWPWSRRTPWSSA